MFMHVLRSAQRGSEYWLSVFLRRPGVPKPVVVVVLEDADLVSMDNERAVTLGTISKLTVDITFLA